MDNVDVIDEYYRQEQEMWEDFENEIKNDKKFWEEYDKIQKQNKKESE